MIISWMVSYLGDNSPVYNRVRGVVLPHKDLQGEQIFSITIQNMLPNQYTIILHSLGLMKVP